MDLNLLLQLTLNGLIVGALYGVVAMSFVLIYKASQVVNFAQGEFLLVGAWVCWWLLTTWQLPFWAGFLVTLAFMTIFGLVLQVIVLRPLIGEPVISVIMATIGLGIFFQALMKWMFGVFAQPFPAIFTTERVSIVGLEVQTVYLLSLGISLMIMIGFAWFFTSSKHGLAMRATAFDQQVAQSLGVSVPKVFAMSWAIYGIKVFPAVILGGLDSVLGAILGGLIVGVLENWAHYLDSQWLNWGNMFQVAPFYALVLILLLKPYGLFGTKNIERV
jgi:branched-chain amino acid transport system permease protein